MALTLTGRATAAHRTPSLLNRSHTSLLMLGAIAAQTASAARRIANSEPIDDVDQGVLASIELRLRDASESIRAVPSVVPTSDVFALVDITVDPVTGDAPERNASPEQLGAILDGIAQQVLVARTQFDPTVAAQVERRFTAYLTTITDEFGTSGETVASF